MLAWLHHIEKLKEIGEKGPSRTEWTWKGGVNRREEGKKNINQAIILLIARRQING